MKDRPIFTYHYYAKEFIKFSWGAKFMIGHELGILDDYDFSMNEDEVEEAVFIGAIRKSKFYEFRKLVFEYYDKDIRDEEVINYFNYYT